MNYIKIYESFISDRIELSNKQKDIEKKFENMIYDTIPDIYTICDVNISYIEKELLNNKWIDVEPHFLLKTNMELRRQGNTFIKDDSIFDTLSNELLSMNRILNDYKIEYLFDNVITKPGQVDFNPKREIITDLNEIIKFMRNEHKDTGFNNNKITTFICFKNLSIKFYKN